jgi:hypothetical protein
MTRRLPASLVALVLLAATIVTSAFGDQARVVLHGREYALRRFGPASGHVALVSSGDGGWIHLAPHVADVLAGWGWTVLGFDSRDYLSRGNDSGGPLTPADVAGDYGALIAQAVPPKVQVTLVGVSEGAGLSVVAATDPGLKTRIGGVVAIGLGDRNELAWHWRDSVIYITKGVPREPLFYASSYLPHIMPVPLAFIQSMHDEFVPPSESDRLQALAGAGARSWKVDAVDHRFSNNLPAFDAQLSAALAWLAHRT